MLLWIGNHLSTIAYNAADGITYLIRSFAISPPSTNLRVTAVEKAKQGETLLLESRNFLGLTVEADGGRNLSFPDGIVA